MFDDLDIYLQRTAFMDQVADLARLNHENTGKLLGYCRESSPFTRMLVFEYASNGTLHEHLHCEFRVSYLESRKQSRVFINEPI